MPVKQIRPRVLTFVLLVASAFLLLLVVNVPLNLYTHSTPRLQQLPLHFFPPPVPGAAAVDEKYDQRELRISNSTLRLRCFDRGGQGEIEDLLCMKRPDYLQSYKNPCWISWTPELQRLSCLPYFHVLGVDKSGTTDLHSRISQHPHVLLNGGGLGKETYYWCWMKYGQWMKGTVKPRSFSQYVALFKSAAATIAANVDPKGFHPLITGDGTPMDFWDHRAWRLIPQNEGLTEPVVLTPHLMRHLYPDPKFILIFRNPVDRLYSDYVFLGYGLSPEQFRVDAPKAVEMMETCMRVNTTRQCVFSNHTYVNLPMRIHIGMYSVFMKEWLSVFPRSSFYILRTEDYQQNMTHHLTAIYSFLGLGLPPEDKLKEIVGAERKHETTRKKKLADMYPDTRKLLQDFYSRYNKELAAMLNDEGFLWPNTSL